jgi:peptidoglycan glycosyltransferase
MRDHDYHTAVRRDSGHHNDWSPLMERRIRWLGVVMALCFIALFVQLNNIQIVKAHALSTSRSNPRVIAVARNDPRGDILSSDGVVLASSIPATKGYYKYQRVYNPFTATLFSQIVGYDTIFPTRTGIEAEYNQFLQSHTRPAKTLSDLLTTRTTTGNVILTVNSGLQLKVAGIVEGINKNGSAPQAGAVVINVKTGAIEAMYGRPTYDPTGLVSQDPKVVTATYNSLDPKNGANSRLVSQAFQHGFLPGSTFKVVTSAAVYDHQPTLAKVDYPLPVPPTTPVAGCIAVPQTPLPLCNYAHEICGGTIQVSLPRSCNTAFAQMGMSLKTSLNTEAEAFGFNKQVPLDLPNVGVSNFPTVAQLLNNAPLQAYSAFGQGTQVSTDIATTLQMGLVAAGIANRGVIMTPHLMQQIRDSEGNLVLTYKPSPWLTATNPLTAAAVTSLMQAVVSDPNGTAYGTFPASSNVAAKTGTAEVGTIQNPLTNDWMIAFAPANDPRVAVAVSVPNQAKSKTGNEIAGPPTAEILAAALAATP